MPSQGTNKSHPGEKWEILHEKELVSADPWLKLSVHQVRLPDGKIVDDYYQIELTEYVVVFAQAETGEAIVLRTYKHGVRDVCLVLPAGSIEKGEEPIESAKRELMEETGYVAQEWNSLGSFIVHGNYGCGTAHIFSATNAKQVAEPDSGDLETMEILLMSPDKVLEAVRNGDVAGLGTVAAIGLALNPAFKKTSLSTSLSGEAD